MDTYKSVKTQYDNTRLQLLKLEILAEQKRRVWLEADCKDKKASKEMTEADTDVRDMQRNVKDVAYKLVPLEYKEFGTSMSKLFREYGISTLTIKKLLKEAGVAYLRPTLVQWLPIGTAPKDGTYILAWRERAAPEDIGAAQRKEDGRMTNNLMARLRHWQQYGPYRPSRYKEAADRIEELEAALRAICEVYAGSEGIPKPMTAAEGYLLKLLTEAVAVASIALGEKKDD